MPIVSNSPKNGDRLGNAKIKWEEAVMPVSTNPTSFARSERVLQPLELKPQYGRFNSINKVDNNTNS